MFLKHLVHLCEDSRGGVRRQVCGCSVASGGTRRGSEFPAGPVARMLRDAVEVGAQRDVSGSAGQGSRKLQRASTGREFAPCRHRALRRGGEPFAPLQAGIDIRQQTLYLGLVELGSELLALASARRLRARQVT